MKLLLALISVLLILCDGYGSQITVSDDLNSAVYGQPRGIGLYKLHTEKKSFQEAQMICESEGGNLAILETFAEASILRYMAQEYVNATSITAHYHIYVGCNDIVEEGLFVSVKNEPLLSSGFFYDWAGSGPDDYGTGEDCCVLEIYGLLNDVDCSLLNPFICEISRA